MSEPQQRPPSWDERYAGTADYVFGTAPNAFLAAQAPRLKPGWTALAIADWEGRNGVWLAQQGLEVVSSDLSGPAQEKAAKLAEARGVSVTLQKADVGAYDWPEGVYDVVVGIFIQFADPALRAEVFAGMKRAVKPGGMILLEGYRPEQIAYGTGGPRIVANLYTEPMLREAFGDFEIVELKSYDAEISEGAGHSGMSALLDLVARRPA